MVKGGAVMEACPNQKKNLVLHAHGELDSRAGKVVENHLAACESCRSEYRQLVSLLGNIGETAKTPELSAKQVNSLVANIKWQLKSGEKEKWWRRYTDYRPPRIIPAVAAACMVVIVAGIIGYESIDRTNRMPPLAESQNEELMLSDKDIEIVKNLEFLKELDAIRKLAQVVDANGEVDSQEESDDETRGMRRDAYRKYFA